MWIVDAWMRVVTGAGTVEQWHANGDVVENGAGQGWAPLSSPFLIDKYGGEIWHGKGGVGTPSYM